MKYYLLILSALLLNCTTKETKPKISNSDHVQSETSTKKIAEIQPLTSLTGSYWIHSPFQNCTDTLTFTEEKREYYSCEHGLANAIDFSIESDTLYLNKYGLISEVNSDLGQEVKSKYKFIKSDNSLIIVSIAHRYGDQFEPVGEEFLYQNFIELK